MELSLTGLPNVHSLESCFAHAINLVVGAFINALSPKRPSNSGSGKGEPVVPGLVPSRLYDESDVAGEEDNEEAIETLRQKLSEIEKDPGTQLSSVRASSLLLRVRAFITKVGEFRNFFTSYPDSLSNKIR